MRVQLRSFAGAKLPSSGSISYPIRGLPFGPAQQFRLVHQLLHHRAYIKPESPGEQAARLPCARRRSKARVTTCSRAPVQHRALESGDAAHWNLSPEWWGTQDGGWGRDAGTTVFRQRSEHGNGEDGHSYVGSEQWRVMRFNDITRQSVNRVRVVHDGHHDTPESRPDCLAFPYLRTMAASGAAFMGFAGMTHAAVHSSTAKQPRALCIGMGGGTLPLFLAHHFPGLAVEVAELDPVVIEAAHQAMGFRAHRPNISVSTGDATAYIADIARRGSRPLDFVFLDAFDGDDNVPESLCSPGSPFMEDLAATLHPRHGTLVMNLHGSGPPVPSLGRWVAGLLAPKNGRAAKRQPGYDVDSAEGMAIQRTGAAFRDALLGRGGPEDRPGGIAYTVSVPRQHNVTLVVSRAVQPGRASGLQHHEMVERLRASAAAVAATASFSFDAEPLVARDYMPL